MNSIGPDYPIRKGQGGYFDKTFTDLDQIKANLFNLLSTRRGERIMNPEFGTGIYRILYQNQTNSTLDAIETEIRDAIDRFMPYLRIDSLLTQFNDDGVLVEIEFGTPQIPGQTEQLNVFLESE